jgi:alanine dehydrogenase
VFGFLHIALAPDELVRTFLDKNITALSYEVVQEEDGRLPLLVPQSEIAGKMAVQIAGSLLESKKKGRRGILLGGLAGIPPAEVVILGGGTLGFAAALSFSGIGASVLVVDKNLERLDEIDRFTSGRVVTVVSNMRNLEKLVMFADVLVGAVLIPGSRAPILVTEKMVQTMKKGSVILDFSVDQGSCVETSRPTPTEESVYSKHGVVHFAMTNVPSLVARTSCYALTNSVLPYLHLIATKGLEGALADSHDLVQGVCIYKGHVSRQNLARESYPFKPVTELLAEG